ncbi:hypothetical protein ABE24_20690 [Cytobacillus firmus]|nr:hypothetical protein [Cytobacillus firmus]
MKDHKGFILKGDFRKTFGKLGKGSKKMRKAIREMGAASRGNPVVFMLNNIPIYVFPRAKMILYP